VQPIWIVSTKDKYRMRLSVSSMLLVFALAALSVNAFVAHTSRPSFAVVMTTGRSVLDGSCRTALHMSDFMEESEEVTQERIQALVDNHPVLLFMKGSKLFPQCGFSNTAVQILNSFGIDFHTVDVLADANIRQGVKVFSQWPTIPQLYVAGEFIGGSDIMIEMYQNGELAEMIEKAKADMI